MNDKCLSSCVASECSYDAQLLTTTTMYNNIDGMDGWMTTLENIKK